MDALNTADDTYTAAEAAEIERLVDIDEWMRIMASRHATGDWDSYGYRKGKNMYLYKPANGRWVLLNWDMSFIYGNGDGPTTDLFDVRNLHNSRVLDPITQKMFQTPVFRRAYLRALQDMVDGPFRDENLHPLLDANYAALIANGVSLSSSSGRPTGIKSFVTNRRAYLQRVLATNSASFSLAGSQTAGWSTNRNLITLQGTAPIGVASILVNGVAYPLQWTSVTNWSLLFSLQPGVNDLSIRGADMQGRLLTNATGQVAIAYTGAGERPEDRLAITEIMYHPNRPDAAYVELFNASTAQAFDLSGWRLAGVDFTFPGGALIPAQSYLVVAKNRRVFAETYGYDVAPLGDYPGQLRNGGETLRLIKPGASSAEDVVIAEVSYDNIAPWPTSADGGGSSLQIIDPLRNRNRVANWTAVGANGYAPSRWQYKSVTGVAAGSRLSVSLAGPGEALLDDVSLVAGISPAGQNLVLGEGGFETPLAGSWTLDADYSASSLTTEAAHGGAYALRVVNTGANAASAVHQDLPIAPGQFYTLSFWCRMSEFSPALTVRVEGQGLTAQPDLLARRTPGKANSVRGSLLALPELWINEVQPENTGAVATADGAVAPWIELFNAGDAVIDLGGFYLSDSATNLSRSPLPAGTRIQPGGFLLLWADAQPGSSTTGETHLTFRLAPGSGALFLSRWQGGTLMPMDYLHYSGLAAGSSIGGHPDGTSPKREVFVVPTPGASNDAGGVPLMLRINEWMADNKNALNDPLDGKSQDWFELYNGGDVAVDLLGFTLTDDPADPAKYSVPSGKSIPARGFLLVWADGEPGQNPLTNHLHTNFKLSKSGGYVGLFTERGALVDQVSYGPQTEDVSEGRATDGAPAPYVFFDAPTPGASNRSTQTQLWITGLSLDGGRVALVVSGRAGLVCQLLFREDLSSGAWSNLGAPVTLTGTESVLTDEAPLGSQRFYQVKVVGGH